MTSTFKNLIDHFGDQSIAAEMLGVKQPTVSGWLNGKHGMSAKTALKAERLTGGKFKASDLCPELAEVLLNAG
ncbi:transcriptional regulator [Alishewanella sp. HL-SH06]|uniref:transcriptional regulator n=1 Tax=Alishewanella sp. HL-SH06 TaxID=3461144 RepID=UPI004041153F